MKDSLAVGLSTSVRITVDEARTIDFMGDEARVYATPALVRDVETTCRNLLLEHVDPGEDSVGVRIELDHLAPTLLDMWVEITVELVELDGRRATFKVTARDAVETVARGRHVRFVVDVAKSAARFQKKAEKAAAA
ncbi:MAG: thioesterase family protein [Anaerolineales bacterium]